LKEFSNYQKIEDEYETKFSGTNSKLYYENGWLYLDYDNYSRNGPGASTNELFLRKKKIADYLMPPKLKLYMMKKIIKIYTLPLVNY
jgi:hypothetical protein